TFSDLYNEKDKSVAAYNKYAEEDKKCAGVTLYRYDSATGKNLPLKGVEAGLESEDSDGNGVADGKECDYTYSKINSVYPGKFTMVFKGINGMTGSIKKTVTIKPYNVKNNVKGNLVAVLAGSEDVLYSKAGARPGVNVKFITARDIDGNELSSVALIEGIDYRVSYKNNTKVADKTAKNAPTVVIKGIGNYTGSSATLKFSVKKAAITSATLIASDVVYKAIGKKGYFLSVPKLYQDGKVLSVGKGKDIEGLNKKDLVYTYAGNTTLLDAYGTVRKEGETVLSTDTVGPGTEIKVSIPASKLSCSAKSAFEHSAFEKEGDEFVGTYRIVEGAKSISKYSASLKDPSKLAFNNANEVIIRESDIVIRKNKKTEPLAVSKYRVKSVSNSRFLGKTIIVIEGRDDYFGTKTISVKISAKKVNGK
nr:hypothetical protein [Butyrivibrio sp.]